MRKTKIFYGNQYKGSFYVGKSLMYKAAKVTKRVLLVLASLNILTWASIGGYRYAKETLAPVTVFAEKKVEVPVKEFPPILQKICNAEVTGDKNIPSHQFNKDGSVVRGKITPSDIGYCQISEIIWNDTARKLGYDIFTEEGNKAMAIWLFENYGSEPWYLSKKNWK